MEQINRLSSRRAYEMRVLPILHNAEGGDLRSIINILSFFCEAARLGKTAEHEIMQFVAEIFHKAQPYKIHKNRQRQQTVRLELDKLRSQRRKRGPSMRRQRMALANRLGVSEERLMAISRTKPDRIVEFYCAVNRGESVDLELVVAVVPNIHQLRNDLLNDGKRGETVRNRLGLKGYRWWVSTEDLHVEIVQDVESAIKRGCSQTRAIKAVAENSGLAEANVKKIVQRSRNKAAQDAIVLINAGLSQDVAVRVIAENTGHTVEAVRKIVIKTTG